MNKSVLLCGLAALMLVACSSGNQNNQARNDDAEDYQQPQERTPELDDFTSLDLSTFNLTGHVKSLKETNDENELVKFIEFSKDGVASVKAYLDSDGKIGRDDQGRIATIGTVVDESQEGTYYRMIYDASGKVISEVIEVPSYFMAFPQQYNSFNEAGWPLSMSTEGGEGGYVMKRVLTYDYPVVDVHGNWTTKMANGKTTEIEMGDFGDDDVTTTDTSIKYQRVITYYSPDELR